MEKLIELLNEWSKTAIKNKCNWTDVYDEEGVYFLNLFDRDMTMEIEDVISKRNGFIKWLVENDKIDTDPIRTRVKRVYVELEPREFTPQDFTDRVIMLLAISDTPIEDLLLYLK